MSPELAKEVLDALEAFVASYTPMPWGCSPSTIARVEAGRAALRKAGRLP